MKSRDGQLRLSDINEQILEVFWITRLDRLFEIHDTADEAMATFGFEFRARRFPRSTAVGSSGHRPEVEHPWTGPRFDSGAGETRLGSG